MYTVCSMYIPEITFIGIILTPIISVLRETCTHEHASTHALLQVSSEFLITRNYYLEIQTNKQKP